MRVRSQASTASPPVPAIGATMLPLSRIVKGKNPRRYFDRAKHEELVVSVRLRGIIQPIVVRPVAGTDRFEIIVGERRYRAALEVYGPDGGMPVVIREMTDEEALEAAIDENDARDDASETEQADAAVRRLAACGNDRAEAARRLGWSRAKLDRRLALADLSETVKCALDERRIKVGHAELLAVIPADKQDKALETILGAGLDVAKTRELLMRVTQDLANASFDKSECTTCPFNSGTQRALFETHVDDGHCTNAACFGLKTQTAEAIRFEEEAQAERAAEAARAANDDAGDTADDGADDDGAHIDDTDGGDGDDRTDEAAADTAPGDPVTSAARPRATASAPAPVATIASRPSTAKTLAVTAASISGRTREWREAAWRTALARALAGNPDNARTTILVAAMAGTLSQIKSETLTSRAGLLIGATFASLGYGGKIAAVRALADPQASNVLAVIGAAYAKDVHSFEHVADLAHAFDVDLRDSWQVDRAFLERFTRDELSFVARECGLVAHIGEKAFAKLLAGKKTDLVTAMLNRTGFDWAGRLPGSMTLDGAYGPPPARVSPPPVTAIAACPIRFFRRITAMLITTLLPLLARYSLGFDLVAGPDDTVTLTIVPRKAEGAAHAPDTTETRPISITASAAEIDAELACGTDGALGQLIAARRGLADQLTEQRQAADDARKAAADAAKAKASTAATGTASPTGAAKPAAPSSPPVDARPDEPASLF